MSRFYVEIDHISVESFDQYLLMTALKLIEYVTNHFSAVDGVSRRRIMRRRGRRSLSWRWLFVKAQELHLLPSGNNQQRKCMK